MTDDGGQHDTSEPYDGLSDEGMTDGLSDEAKFELEQWMQLIDENPVLGFLIQKNLLEIDIDRIEPVSGTSSFLITAKGWEVAFQLLLFQALKTADPELEFDPIQLVAAGRGHALRLLVESMRALAEETPEEADDEAE